VEGASEAVQLQNSQQGWIVPRLGPPEVTVRIYRVARPAGFSNDGPGRGLHNAQLAFELRHLGREHGTDRLHCLRSPVGSRSMAARIFYHNDRGSTSSPCVIRPQLATINRWGMGYPGGQNFAGWLATKALSKFCEKF